MRKPSSLLVEILEIYTSLSIRDPRVIVIFEKKNWPIMQFLSLLVFKLTDFDYGSKSFFKRSY